MEVQKVCMDQGLFNRSLYLCCSRKCLNNKSTSPIFGINTFPVEFESLNYSNGTYTKSKELNLNNSTDCTTDMKVFRGQFQIIQQTRLFSMKRKEKTSNSMMQMFVIFCAIFIQKAKRFKRFKWSLLSWSAKSPILRTITGWVDKKVLS